MPKLPHRFRCGHCREFNYINFQGCIPPDDWVFCASTVLHPPENDQNVEKLADGNYIVLCQRCKKGVHLNVSLLDHIERKQGERARIGVVELRYIKPQDEYRAQPRNDRR